MFIQGLDQAQGGDTLFHHIHLQVKIYEIPQLVIPVSLFFTEAANHALTPDGPLLLVQLDHPGLDQLKELLVYLGRPSGVGALAA